MGILATLSHSGPSLSCSWFIKFGLHPIKWRTCREDGKPLGKDSNSAQFIMLSFLRVVLLLKLVGKDFTVILEQFSINTLSSAAKLGIECREENSEHCWMCSSWSFVKQSELSICGRHVMLLQLDISSQVSACKPLKQVHSCSSFMLEWDICNLFKEVNTRSSSNFTSWQFLRVKIAIDSSCCLCIKPFVRTVAEHVSNANLRAFDGEEEEDSFSCETNPVFFYWDLPHK